MEKTAPKHALALATLLAVDSGHATEHCIATQEDLQALVDQSFGPGGLEGDRYVKLVEGEYEIGSPDLVVFDGSLTVEGGYEPGCQIHHPGAHRTVLRDSAGVGRPSFHAFNGGDVIVRDLTMSGYGGAYIWPQAPGAKVLLERVSFLLATGQFDGLQLFPTNGDVVIENVLIDAGTLGATQCALRGNSPTRMALSFVTLVNRAAGQGMCLSSSGELSVTNSIILSDGADFEAPVAATLLLRNSNMAEIPAVLAPGSTANSVAPIEFENSASSMLRNRPADTAVQPARDSGFPLPAITLDLLGEARSIGAAPDRGAFELQLADEDSIFADGFEPH